MPFAKFPPNGRLGFAFFFVSRIQIRCVRFKLRRASINPFINRRDVQIFAMFADFRFG